MAGMKRPASKAAGARGKKQKGSNAVAKKCSVIAPSIRDAASLPQPVRKMISDRLGLAFGTYKEERHPFQNTVSNLVRDTLKATEKSLQASINEANSKKSAQEKEGSALINASNQANAESEAAATAMAGCKDALAGCNTAKQNAKAGLHDLKSQVKSAEAEAASLSGQKEQTEALIRGLFAPVKEGTLDKGLSKSAAYAGRYIEKEFNVLEHEFITCVVRTFSKAASAWGTFDHIVDKELNQELTKILATLAKQIAEQEALREALALQVEAAKGAVAAAEEQVKAAEEALTNATHAAKDAKAAAKTAAAAAKVQHQLLDKASHVCTGAEHALTKFREGALAAYAEVEAHTAPPPEPEAEAPEPAQTAPSPRRAGALDAAMMPAPAVPAGSPAIQPPAPSPLIAFAARAMGISPRVA